MADEHAAPAWARGHVAPLEYHRTLLDDVCRLDAYDRALRALVRPGDVVLDLGCGTGVLALLAARRGAARVHAVESQPVAHVAATLARTNGLADRVRVHHADALTLAPVEPVDLVVSDFMGRFVVDDGMLPAVAAATRWLRPGGRFCPARVVVSVAPAGEFALRPVDLFHEPLLGLDLSAASHYPLHFGYHVRLGPEVLLAPPAVCHDLALPLPAGARPAFDAALSFRCERAGLLRGLLGWWEATLAPGVLLDTGPGSDTHWGQYLFPLPPLAVAAGDRLAVRLWVEEGPSDLLYRWEGALHRAAGGPPLPFALESEQRLGAREDAAPAVPPPGPSGRAAVVAAEQRGRAAFAAGHLPAAITAFEDAIRALGPAEDDLAPALYEAAGLTWHALGCSGPALRAFLRALDGDPGRSAPALRHAVTLAARAGHALLARRLLAAWEERFGPHPDGWTAANLG